MANESLGTSDGASIGATRHHTLDQIAHHATALFRPADLWGHSVEELLDLAHTRHHGGDPVVSAPSLDAALSFTRNAVRVAVRDPQGDLKQLILDKNCRTNKGGIWQSILMGGDANANIGYVNTSGAVTYAATTVTPTASPTWTVNQWAGHKVVAPTTIGATPSFVEGVIISNSATALTIDQWTNPTSTTGAAGSTPPANASFVIQNGQAPAFWVAMSTDTTVEDIGDTTLTGEFTANFSTTGRWKGVYSLTTTPSGTGTTNSNAVLKIDAGVLTCSTGVTVAKLGLTHFQNGGTMDFTKKLSTAATAAISDTVDPSWAETLS